MLVKRADKLLTSPAELDQLQPLADWAMQTRTGALAGHQFPAGPGAVGRVRSESGSCRGGKCQEFGRCFYQAARRRMLKADVLVVNHALFFADLALKDEDATVLGDYDLAVLDEAHTIEAVASDHFGQSLTAAQVRRLLGDLYNDRTDRGLLALTADRLAIGAVYAAGLAAEDFFARAATLAGGGHSKRHVPGQDVQDILSPPLEELVSQLSRLAKETQSADEQAELAAAGERVGEIVAAVAGLTTEPCEDHAYWVTVRQGGRGAGDVILACAAIEVGPVLRERLFDRVNSIVLTSATLTTGRSGQRGFEYIRQRLGLPRAAGSCSSTAPSTTAGRPSSTSKPAWATPTNCPVSSPPRPRPSSTTSPRARAAASCCSPATPCSPPWPMSSNRSAAPRATRCWPKAASCRGRRCSTASAAAGGACCWAR